MLMRRLVLSSKSPRRSVLLRYLLDEFDVDATDVVEIAPRALPVAEALEVISRKKALATSVRRPDDWILAADTVVVQWNQLLGKARSPQDTRSRLRALSGETHEVVTGLALARGEQCVDAESVTTKVRFDVLEERLIYEYVRSEAWVGKAGGYGIQDKLLAPHIHVVDGPWSNVVGLPLAATKVLLERNGIACAEPPSEARARLETRFE